MALENLTSDNNMGLPSLGAPAAADGGASPRKAVQLGKGNLLLAGLFAAGVVCIYLLSLQGGPSSASAQQNQTQEEVDNVLSKLTLIGNGASAKKDDAVTKTLYYEAKQRQVPLSSLSGNPFVLTRVPIAVAASQPEAQASQQEMLKSQPENQGSAIALAEVKKLTLQTILTGSAGSTAMISNNLLTEGQTLCGWTVSSIRPKEVVLTWKDMTYVLRLP